MRRLLAGIPATAFVLFVGIKRKVCMKKEFVHPEWGVVKIALNSRARRIIMRAREDGIYVTAPPMATSPLNQISIDSPHV